MTNETRVVDPIELPSFLTKRPFSVIHLDATWNGQRFTLQRQIDALVELIADTSFGYVDVDEHQGYARTVGVRNVPSCAYYRGLELIATVIGMQQDVARNLQIIRDGGIPEASNDLSRM